MNAHLTLSAHGRQDGCDRAAITEVLISPSTHDEPWSSSQELAIAAKKSARVTIPTIASPRMTGGHRTDRARRRQVRRFHEVRTAFLEERPFLDEAVASVAGPVVVVGLFSGEGLHGAKDAPRLTAELGRDNIVFAGVIGSAPGIDDLVRGL